MKIHCAINKLITPAMAIAAMAVIGSGWATGSTAAQTNTAPSTLTTPPVGFVPHETLRFTVFNPNAPEGGEPVSAQTYVYDAAGRLVSATVPTTVLPGQFIVFEFNRDDLQAVGEPGTDRLEVRADVRVAFTDRWAQHSSRTILISRETIARSTGSTSHGGDYYTGTVTVSGEG